MKEFWIEEKFEQQINDPNLASIGWLCTYTPEEGIPFLNLDCDSISSSDYFEGQLNSRIDSFLHMLS